MIKISYILPAYRVEPYIEKCILSIIATDLPFHEYEIIAINDGSPDKSQQVIEGLQAQYPNIVLINQQNQGVAAARNVGLDIAKGEYIVFVDPDDFLAGTEVNKHYEYAKLHNLDILLFGRSTLSQTGKLTMKCGYLDLEGKFFDGVEAFEMKDAYWLNDKSFAVWDTSWGRFYKKELIDKYLIRHPIVPFMEDAIFVRLVFAVSEKVAFSNQNFYTYYLSSGSTTRSVLSDERLKAYIHGYIKGYNYLREFKEKYPLNQKQEAIINGAILKFAMLPITTVINKKKYKYLFYAIKQLKLNQIRKLQLAGLPYDMEYVSYAKSFNVSPYFLCLHFRFNLLKIKLNQILRIN
jgi:glycosyltransferase involved in cell wall biosynthesis